MSAAATSASSKVPSRPGMTDGQTSGTVTTGVFPDNSYPLVDGELDFEQQKRLQARQESEWAAGDRPDHPAFTRKGPDATVAEAQA